MSPIVTLGFIDKLLVDVKGFCSKSFIIQICMMICKTES